MTDLLRIRSRISYPALWAKIVERLDLHLPTWKEKINALGQVNAVEKRRAGGSWSDSEVLEALMMSVLSNSMDWSKVQVMTSDLRVRMSGYDLDLFAESTDDELMTLYRWFTSRRSGSMTLRSALGRLREASKILVAHSKKNPQKGAIGFFDQALAEVGGPIDLAMAIGMPSCWKIPGMGVPLAAEALRNLGYDIAKPDRHLVRAAAMFGMVQFSRTASAEGHWSAPTSTQSEQRQTMVEFQNLAVAVGHITSFVDNAVWLLCAKSGLHFTNSQLEHLKGSVSA